MSYALVMFWRNWNFRQKPSGLWKRALKLPAYLFRMHLGFLMGERLLLLTHVGRRSGIEYQTAIEIVEHDKQRGEYFVCSGTGPHADWYQNITAHPAVRVQVGNRSWQPSQRFLSQQEAAERFARYEAKHRRMAGVLLRSMGNTYDGTDEGRIQMMAHMPMVGFSSTDVASPVDHE